MSEPSHDLTENKMGTMPITRLLLNMALPLIISMLVQAMYNIVDSIYISRVSESAVTALGLAFPIQNLIISFGVGTAVGVNALLSRSLGERNEENTNLAAGNGLFLVVLFSVIFALFGLFGARPYFEMQSDVAETVNGGSAYLQICSIFSLGCLVQILCERLLQATGRSMLSMVLQGTGAALNILLDPVFIFGWFGLPAMGVAGAAVATVLAQWIAAVIGILLNLRYNHDIHLARRFFRPHGAIIRIILSISIPSILMIGIGSVMTFGMNQILQGFNETATGVFGIYFKLQSFVFMPVFGINNATISIIAYNYGAQKPQRVMSTVHHAMVTACCIMVLGTLAFEMAPDLLLDIFNPTPEFSRMGRVALRVIATSFPMAAIGIAISGFFQALGKSTYSALASLCRQLLVLLPAAWVLSLWGNVDFVWWSFPISEVASLLISLILYRRLFRAKIRPLYNA